jgi:hypothetical protein
MPRKLLAAVVCIAGLVAGCGSGSKASTTSQLTSASSKSMPATSTSPAIESLAQAALTMGPPPAGSRYNAVDHAFLQRLATILGHELESRGLSSVNVTCTASIASRATCNASGTSLQGQGSSGTLAVGIDRTTGQLRFRPK